MENKEEKFRHMMLEYNLYPSIKGPVFELMNKSYELGQAEFIKLIEGEKMGVGADLAISEQMMNDVRNMNNQELFIEIWQKRYYYEKLTDLLTKIQAL